MIADTPRRRVDRRRPPSQPGLPNRNPPAVGAAFDHLPGAHRRDLSQRHRCHLHWRHRRQRVGYSCTKCASSNNAVRSFEERGRKLPMFSHMMIGTNDLDKAKAFYDALLGTLDVRPAHKVDGHLYALLHQDRRVLWQVQGQSTASPRHTPMAAPSDLRPSPEQADAWHAAGIANGGTTCENPPGIREGSGRQTVPRLSARS